MGRNKIRFCQDCNGEIKNKSKTTKRCKTCYFKYRSSGAYKNTGLYVCTCGGNKSRVAEKCIKCNSKDAVKIMNCEKCGKIRKYKKGQRFCKKCYDANMAAKNLCKKCGNKRARNTSEYCHKCYRGDVTKRWNPELTDEFRKKGRTVNPEYYIWHINVFERDKYQCQKCGDKKGGNLTAHHVFSFKDYPELRTDVDNGITFCEKCHTLFHKTYGWGNNNRMQLNEYLGIK